MQIKTHYGRNIKLQILPLKGPNRLIEFAEQEGKIREGELIWVYVIKWVRNNNSAGHAGYNSCMKLNLISAFLQKNYISLSFVPAPFQPLPWSLSLHRRLIKGEKLDMGLCALLCAEKKEGERVGGGEVEPGTRAVDQNGEALSFLEVLEEWWG